MPVYHFSCEVCAKLTRRLLSDKTQEPGPCPGCGGKLTRVPAAPSVVVMERLDAGTGRKVLERFSDAEAVFGERKDRSIREARRARGEDVGDE